LNYYSFLSKYFPGSRQDEINRTLTTEKFMKLFGVLSLALPPKTSRSDCLN
jgi:ATP-dependent DNA helicase RecQ